MWSSLPQFDISVPPPPLPSGFIEPIAPTNYLHPCYPVHGFTEPPPPILWPSYNIPPPVLLNTYSNPPNPSYFQNTSTTHLKPGIGKERYAHSSSYRQDSFRSDNVRQSSRRLDHANTRHYSRSRRSRSRSRVRYPRSSRHHNYYDRKRRSRSRDRRKYRNRSRSSYRYSRLDSRSRAVSSHRSRNSHTARNAPRESDRKKITNKYRKKNCNTSTQHLTEKVEQRSTEHNEKQNRCRCSPASLYYRQVTGTRCVEQTPRLKIICEIFKAHAIKRGRKARPEIDELPPLKLRDHNIYDFTDDENVCESSESENFVNNNQKLFTKSTLFELHRKQSHPRRLHPELWYNTTKEMNGSPLCDCSESARQNGIHHGVFVDEPKFKRCILNQNNIDKLYYYKITVTPSTNFDIRIPTKINHDKHDFYFSGFSMFSHYKLGELPPCTVIRYNNEHTILYEEAEPPHNFSIQELDLFEEYLFIELLELMDLDLGKSDGENCTQFHFMPIFIRTMADGDNEVLSMCHVLMYLADKSTLLVPPKTLQRVHESKEHKWCQFADKIKGMIVTNPGKKPCSLRLDQLDRTPPPNFTEAQKFSFFPEIVHFGIRPSQLRCTKNSICGKARRDYVTCRKLVANMAKSTQEARKILADKEAKLKKIRILTNIKRDVTVAVSSQGFYATGLLWDVVQHALMIPVLVHHLRFHKSLEAFEKRIGYSFSSRALLQTAFTHTSYEENFGTNPDHARNSLSNCGIRKPKYGNCQIQYARKKRTDTLVNIMSHYGKPHETVSTIKHNQRLEFLGNAVVKFVTSMHLFKMFPNMTDGRLGAHRRSIVKKIQLAMLAKKIDLDQFILYSHTSGLCLDVTKGNAMASCFKALMGALFLDGGIQVADRVFALSLWYTEPHIHEIWIKEHDDPLQEEEPLGDRKHIKTSEFLQRLVKFEDYIGITFKHIRLLARAFTDRSIGFTELTLGSNEHLKFLGDAILKLIVTDRVYHTFPGHNEEHLFLLRSSLVNNRIQARVCDILDMSSYMIYNNAIINPIKRKHKASLLKAIIGAVFLDKGMFHCQLLCKVFFFPRLHEFIMNQDWNDPKSKLQHFCMTLRSTEGGEPDMPIYKFIRSLRTGNNCVHTVAVYFHGKRLANASGRTIYEAEMNAAEAALSNSHGMFPVYKKRVLTKVTKVKKNEDNSVKDKVLILKYKKLLEEKIPTQPIESSDKISFILSPHAEYKDDASSFTIHDDSDSEVKNDSDFEVENDSDVDDNALADNQATAILEDMEELKKDMMQI